MLDSREIQRDLKMLAVPYLMMILEKAKASFGLPRINSVLSFV
jgi:hypothetical protein